MYCDSLPVQNVLLMLELIHVYASHFLSLVLRSCTFVSSSMIFAQKAWARSSVMCATGRVFTSADMCAVLLSTCTHTCTGNEATSH